MNFFTNFDSSTKRVGIARSSQILLSNLNLKVESKMKNFPKKGAVLIYANHPTGLDPFILASVIGRDDFLFLGDIYHSSKGKNISKHIAKTVRTSFLGELIKRRPTNWPGFINMNLKFPPVNKKLAHRINEKALDQIVDNLKKGHVSLIFPSGGQYEFLPWKHGINKIWKLCQEKKLKVSLYKIKISRFSELKLMFHLLTFKKLFSNLEIDGYIVDTIYK